MSPHLFGKLGRKSVVATNLIIIDTVNESDIAREILGNGINTVHCTNGTYAYPREKILPTILSGFQFVADRFAASGDAFLVAVNSDASMADIMTAKGSLEKAESQQVRIAKFAGVLAEQFPDRKIVVAFYDKATPTDLYQSLKQEGLGMASLYKWGYGTDPKAPKIEGASSFDHVLAFPMLNDARPVCYDLTPVEDQTGIVSVFRLEGEQGAHGKPYLSAQTGKALFPVPASAADIYEAWAGVPASGSSHPKPAR
jgi:hypothetical protein